VVNGCAINGLEKPYQMAAVQRSGEFGPEERENGVGGRFGSPEVWGCTARFLGISGASRRAENVRLGRTGGGSPPNAFPKYLILLYF
jgi:hypothetical protein